MPFGSSGLPLAGIWCSIHDKIKATFIGSVREKRILGFDRRSVFAWEKGLKAANREVGLPNKGEFSQAGQKT